MTDIEIFWPSSLPADAAEKAQTVLREAGIDASCRLQPVRRGTESVLVLFSHAALEPVLGAVLGRLGTEVWSGLAALVGHLLNHTAGPSAPKVAIFESVTSGAQFVFTSDLPEDAFKKAVEIDSGAQRGRWTWDAAGNQWVCFENR